MNTNVCQRFRTSHCTVLCGNITIYVKVLINYKLLSVGNLICAPANQAGVNISMSLCAKPLVCDTPLCVPRSLGSLQNYSQIKNQSLLRSIFDKDATYFKFANVSDRL